MAGGVGPAKEMESLWSIQMSTGCFSF